MKSPSRLCFVSSVFLALGVTSQGQTIEWGSPADQIFKDSYGEVLDNSFVFELGAFADSFIPDEDNTGDWLSFWRVFDRADYNMDGGKFESVVNMTAGGLSDSAYLTPFVPGFEGLQAYLWIRNSDDPVPGSEWLLVRASGWVFPDYDPVCCTGPPIQWSISDLTGTDMPVWGKQNEIPGGGTFTVTGPYDLQTHTFIPEPSGSLLLILGVVGLAMVRRRHVAAH